MNKTPYEAMQELSILIGEINYKWGAVNRCRGMNPEDVPPEFYWEFVSAKLIDAGYRKGREGKWELGKSGLVRFCSVCHNFTSLNLAREWNYCPYCGAKMEVQE